MNVILRDVSIPVTFKGGTGQIAGRLSVPEGARTIQVLVHGFSYDRRYWDFPHDPERHSYVRRATAAGYATLAIDRLGSGTSTRPPGRRLTWTSAADTVGQVIDAVRAGLDGHHFDKVVLVGHSYGSVTAYRVADTHAGVDALIATGMNHRVSVVALTRRLVMRCRPIPPDAPFDLPDRAFVMTAWGSRPDAFNLTSPDRELIALDEQLKQPAGVLELPTALAYLLPGLSRQTNLPVLTVNGGRDPLWRLGPQPGAGPRPRRLRTTLLRPRRHRRGRGHPRRRSLPDPRTPGPAVV